MADYIQNNTLEEQTNILAQYLRDDDLHAAKNIEDANFRKVLKGLSAGLVDVNNNLNITINEANIKNANALLEKWEEMFGIPDDCLGIADTVQGRINNILIKLAGLQGTFEEQCYYIFGLLGYTGVEIINGVDRTGFPLKFPIKLTNSADTPFIVYIIFPSEFSTQKFPLKFPIKFGGSFPQIECIINKIKPANVKIIYEIKQSTGSLDKYLALASGDLLITEGGDYISFF